MNWANFRLISALAFMALSLGLMGPALAQAADPNLDRCTQYAHIKANHDAVLSTKPAIICSIESYSAVANAHVDIFDSPDGTSTHGQAKVVAELGCATAGNTCTSGKIDRLTQYGIYVQSNNAEVFISWDD